MTAEFTQGYPDWGRVLAANPQAFLDDVQVPHSNNDTVGPFPISGWHSLYYEFEPTLTDARLEFILSNTPAIGDAFHTDRRWTIGGLTRRGWFPLVGQFLFVRLVQATPTPGDDTNIRLIPVTYVADRDRTLSDLFLIANTVTVAAATTHIAESLDVYLGPAIFMISSNATVQTTRLRWRNFSNVLTDFMFFSLTHSPLPSFPATLYVPDGRVRLEWTNGDAAARGLTYSMIPQKPALGSG